MILTAAPLKDRMGVNISESINYCYNISIMALFKTVNNLNCDENDR